MQQPFHITGEPLHPYLTLQPLPRPKHPPFQVRPPLLALQPQQDDPQPVVFTSGHRPIASAPSIPLFPTPILPMGPWILLIHLGRMADHHCVLPFQPARIVLHPARPELPPRIFPFLPRISGFRPHTRFTVPYTRFTSPR